MSDTSLQLAFAGLPPARLAAYVAQHGRSGALAAVRAGRIELPDRLRRQVERPAAESRRVLAALGMEFIPRGAPGYPAVLARFPDAPPGLFVRGRLDDGPAVAVVGTRRCTEYGRRLATGYGRAIAEAGWTLVSGLARGIDAAAHRGTVAAAGRGVAVLGCGLDVAYPRRHGELRDRLLSCGGALVSEYPPGAAPLAWRFPPRNRIISGLARAVVVVEAGVRGGALITARIALEQGSDVFAVPGDVDRESSRGCNLLIRDGAHPVLDPEDLVEELSLVLGPPSARPDPGAGTSHDGVLGEVERAGTARIESLAARLGMSAAGLLAEVVRLEAAGRVTFDGITVRPAGRRPGANSGH